MKKFRKNRGEITSSQFVTFVLTLVGFVILLLIFPTLLNQGEIDREVCHTSVIFRATLPDTFNLKNLPSLKCQTAKFCITDKVFGKPDCEEDFKGEKFETVRVSSDKDKVEEEINRFIARELASCWAMMGQGKIQIFTRELTTEKRCSICSRIAFDKSLKEDLKEVNGLGNYILTRKVPNQNVSYWKYLEGKNEIENSDDLGSFTTKEKTIVFMEIGESNWEDFASKTFFTLVGGWFGSVKGAGAGYVVGSVIGNALDKEIKYYSGWIFRDYDFEELKDLECSSFENLS